MLFKLCTTIIIICTVGMAVDWINDKIYWTAGDKIFEFDPNTDNIIDISTLTDGNPMGIGIFPHKNNA